MSAASYPPYWARIMILVLENDFFLNRSHYYFEKVNKSMFGYSFQKLLFFNKENTETRLIFLFVLKNAKNIENNKFRR